MNLSEHKMLVSFVILAALVGLSLPLRPLFSLLLLLYFPGIYLASFIKRELDLTEAVFFPLLFGISFWVCFSYLVSELKILHWITVICISFLSAVLADRRKVCINKNYDIFFLVIFFFFMISYLYPWSQFYEWIPPGDDMKYHAPIIENIHHGSLPENYGPLYFEISPLTYPMGYHIVVALALFSEVSLPSIVKLTLLVLPLACSSFYFLGRTLFDRRTGLYSAFSLSFLSLFFQRLSTTSTYPNLLGITIQVFAFFLLIETLREKSYRLLFLTVLTFAASGEIHPYTLLLNLFFLFFLFIYFLGTRNFSRLKTVTIVGAGSILLCTPYFLKLHVGPLTEIEMRTLAVWYAGDSIQTLPDLIRTVSAISPLVIFFGILGGIALRERKKAVILLLLGASMMIIPILSFFEVYYPMWYTISPNRFVLYLFIPLCILCGVFFSDLEKNLSRRKFLFFMIIVALFSVGMHHCNLFHSFFEDPVSEVQMNPDDAFVIQWIQKNTSEDSVILNTGAAADCSSWVPVLSKRRVIFPVFSGYRGDNCVEKVGAHVKREDLWIIRYVPDSDLALQILRKYDIDYIYIPAWRKKLYLDLDPERLLESPLYKPVAKKGNAFLFRVNYDKRPETTFFVVMSRKDITMEGEQLFWLPFSPVLSADVHGKFFLEVKYTDDSYGYIDIGQYYKYIATILKYKMGEEKSMMYPLSGMKDFDLLFYPEFDFLLKELHILFGLDDAIKISEDIGLKGKWVTTLESGSRKVIAAPEDSDMRIYLFDVCKGELVLTYEDTGYGNVDINVSDLLGNWHGVTTIYRENTGETREVRILIDRDYTVFVLGVYVHGENFIITDLNIWEANATRAKKNDIL